MNWLIKKLKVKVPFDENKLYASEILSILLQTEPENRKLFGELDAIDILLQQLAYYKRHDPGEKEILFFLKKRQSEMEAGFLRMERLTPNHTRMGALYQPIIIM